MLPQVLDAVRSGDRDTAYKLARSAYLDHFENAEVPLRLRNPNLTLDVEFKFAKLRNDIRDGEPMGTLESDVVAIRGGLDDATRSLRRRASGRRCWPSATRSASCSARASRRCC